MKKENTIATTFRGDIREVATIALYLDQKNARIENISQLLKTSISCFSDIIIQNLPQCEITTLHEAVKVLERLSLFDLEKPFRNKKTLTDGLLMESRKLSTQTTTTSKQPKNPFGTELERKQVEDILQQNLDLDK